MAKEKIMEKEISRRGFLKTGALVLGAVAIGKFTPSSNAEQIKTMSSEGFREETMPHVIVKLWPGRSEEQKKQLADKIVKDIVEIIECGEESVSVAIEEIKPGDWKEKVYEPDIINNQNNLYKKPGYSM